MGYSRGATLLLVLGLCVSIVFEVSDAATCDSMSGHVHKKTYRSPALKSRPGDVNNKYFEIESPPGHFATRDFDAELVLENGESVPLTDVYLHHWIMIEYGVPTGQKLGNLEQLHADNPAHVYNNGVRDDKKLVLQNWAKGAETRKSNSTLYAPYGLEGGGVPAEYESQWVLNVHGIDTRGALHRMGCTECRCDLFTGGERRPLPENYHGGLRCCVDEARCLLKENFNGDYKSLERTMYLQYTWSYVKYDDCVVPLVNVGLDVTNQGDGGTVEFEVSGSCIPEDFNEPECVDVRESHQIAKYGGEIIYARSHLHAYSLDSTLWGEDGRVICHSSPIYGHGSEAGNEKGYVVGIVHCIPSFGTSGNGKVKKGEKLRYQVKYTRVDGPHTGVMGVMFLHVAPESETTAPVAISTPAAVRSLNRKITY